MRHRQTAGKTPPAQSSQPSAEELRARSRTGTLKFRRNPWHWRDRTQLDKALADMGGECSLVIFDPPSAFLDDVDENSNAEVRGVLRP